MSAMTLSTISSALADFFEDRVAMQINRAVVLAQLLPKSAGQGKNIQWVARFGSAAPTANGVIADGADVSVYESDTKVPAVLQFGTYNQAFSLTGKARAAAMAAGNPNELMNLFAEEFEEATQRLAVGIGTDLYTGAGTSNIIMGLIASAGGLAATGTYAGIDRGTYTQWAGNVLANGGVERPVTFELMRAMRRTIYTASGLKPDLIVCDPLTHERYGNLFGSERRYIQDVRLRGEKITLDGGYQVLEFDGIPVVEDVLCPAGNMLFLNTAQVHLKQLPDMVDGVNRASGSAAVAGTDEERFGAGPIGMNARIQPLATTGDAFKFQLILYPQLQVRRPNACGWIDDLETT